MLIKGYDHIDATLLVELNELKKIENDDLDYDTLESESDEVTFITCNNFRILEFSKIAAQTWRVRGMAWPPLSDRFTSVDVAHIGSLLSTIASMGD